MREIKSAEEMVEDIANALLQSEGETIQDIANQVLPANVQYVEDSIFEVFWDEEDEIETPEEEDEFDMNS